MPEQDHQLFIVKANDGIAVRLSRLEGLIQEIQCLEVVLYGLSAEKIGDSSLKPGRLIEWSPYTSEYYERVPENVEAREQIEILYQNAAARPDANDENVLFALLTPEGYCVRTQNELLASAPHIESCETLSLQDIQFWALAALRQGLVSDKERSELAYRTDAACEKYGWPELGKQYDAKGQHEQTRNIAYLILRRGMTFHEAAFGYLAALERGIRQVTNDDELNSAATDLLHTMNTHLNWARLALVAGVPLASAKEAAAKAGAT